MQEQSDSRTLAMLKQLLPRGRTNAHEWAKEPGTVLIAAEEESLKAVNAQLALCMAVNEISRLYPIITHIGVLVPDCAILSAHVPLFLAGNMRDVLSDFIKRLKPDCKVECLSTPEGQWDTTLSIGVSKASHSNTISIASDGWIAHVSANKPPVRFTNNLNPIGAYVAACIGGMETFKRVFLKKSNLLSPRKGEFDVRWRLRLIEDQISFSAFSYEVNERRPKNPLLPSNVDVGDLCIVGAGAGGGALAYSLASLGEAHGRLYLFDPDEVKPGNMNRYIYAVNADSSANRSKIETVKSLFTHLHEIDIELHQHSYQELKESRRFPSSCVLVSTVDTKEARRFIQWDMPRVILDAAVVSTAFYISRVDVGKSPCLLCTHEPEKLERPLEDIISEATGIDAKEVKRLRSTNARFTREHISRMEKLSEIHGFALPTIGEHFSDWLTLHCGEIALLKTQDRIPLPFATILPGILLAGEIIKDHYFPKDVINNYYSYDLINVPQSGMTPLKPAPDCAFCSSPLTAKAYRRKYGRNLEE